MDLEGIDLAMRPAMLTAALLGFHGAKARHDAALGLGDLPRLLIPLTECTYWACVLDEQLRETVGYAKLRDDHHDGRVIAGMRHARNLNTHRLPLTVRRQSGGVSIPMTIPAVFKSAEVVWQEFEKLPKVLAPYRNRYTLSHEAAYEQFLGNQPTRLTLDAAARWFAAEQNRPGTALAGARISRGA